MIVELIKTYFPEMLVVLGVIGPLMPFLRSRIISDKNMTKVFGDVKEMALKLGFKEEKIDASLMKIDQVTKSVADQVEQFELRLSDKIKELDQSIINFMDSDLFKKMLLGIDQLDLLAQTLEIKDTTIQELGIVIKELKANILEIKQKLG